MSLTTEAPAKQADAVSYNGHRKRSLPRATRRTATKRKPAAKQPLSPWQVVPISVERIEPSPYQPRLSFDESEMADLVANVRAKGVQQPVLLRTCKADQEAIQNGALSVDGNANGNPPGKANGRVNPNLVRYELIAGERRLRACKEAGRRTIPAIIRDDLSDAECAELALLENVQRSNLSVIEEARGYKRLMVQFRMKEERIAKKVGKSVATIRSMMSLLQLPEAVQKLLAERKLTASHGQELLQFAAYERVCVLVVERVVRDHLTALSLQSTPLPNVAELKRLGLVAELEFRTKFDWKSECGKCPHKAYVRSGFNCYCLRPDEWNKKQTAAIEQHKQEAARVMEEARQANGNAPVKVSQLTPGSFRNLSHGTPPAGCTESCPCHSEVLDPKDPTKRIPVCLDPSRYNGLVKEERQAHEDARRQKYLALWQEAKDALRADVEGHALSRMVTLLALPVLQAECCRYVDAEQWESLARMAASSVGVYMPWDDLLDRQRDHGELYALLHREVQTQTPEKLLLLLACLLLAYEGNQATRFGGETPRLDFVLGQTQAQQQELEEQENEESH